MPDKPVELDANELAHPPLVYQDSDGSVQLSPIVAQLAGDGLRLDEFDHVRGFQNRRQRARWRVQITMPGTYQIEAQTICTGPTREAKMRVHVGQKRFVEGVSQLSDNSRQIVTTSLGVLDLHGPETYQVELEMTGLPLVGDFAVGGIRFVSLEDLPSAVPRFSIEAAEKDGP